jgi:hypothetical protein
MRKEDPRWHVCGIPEVLYSDNGSDYCLGSTELRFLYQIASRLIVGFTII